MDFLEVTNAIGTLVLVVGLLAVAYIARQRAQRRTGVPPEIDAEKDDIEMIIPMASYGSAV